MQTSQENRIESFLGINLSKKQIENCLYPLWLHGDATAQEVAEFIHKPINEVTGRFNECSKCGLIITSPTEPSKIGKSGKKNTNYILTSAGKDEIRNRKLVKQPSEMGREIFSPFEQMLNFNF
jgi:hypothetical protein